MDLVRKFLDKLDARRRAGIADVLEKLEARDFSGLDIKKLKGKQNLFRVRKGRIRILYSIGEDDVILVRSIEFRSDTTYE